MLYLNTKYADKKSILVRLFNFNKCCIWIAKAIRALADQKI